MGLHLDDTLSMGTAVGGKHSFFGWEGGRDVNPLTHYSVQVNNLRSPLPFPLYKNAWLAYSPALFYIPTLQCYDSFLQILLNLMECYK